VHCSLWEEGDAPRVLSGAQPSSGLFSCGVQLSIRDQQGAVALPSSCFSRACLSLLTSAAFPGLSHRLTPLRHLGFVFEFIRVERLLCFRQEHGHHLLSWPSSGALGPWNCRELDIHSEEPAPCTEVGKTAERPMHPVSMPGTGLSLRMQTGKCRYRFVCFFFLSVLGFDTHPSFTHRLLSPYTSSCKTP
jgi:hypothetical protein